MHNWQNIQGFSETEYVSQKALVYLFQICTNIAILMSMLNFWELIIDIFVNNHLIKIWIQKSFYPY